MSARNILLKNGGDILQWINKKQLNSHNPILYSSVDIRESKFKIAPVDINLFPSGFNNFADQIDLLRTRFSTYTKDKTRIGLLVENFTRNKNYLDNIKVLQECLNEAQLLTINPELMQVVEFVSDGNGAVVDLDQFDLIILNNDLNISCPDDLLAIRDKVLPDPRLGWYSRRKNIHLEIYNKLIDDMCNDLKLNCDPWLFKTIITKCTNIDFRKKIGLEELAEQVDKTLIKISEKYLEHSIKDTPHVFVKANNGTFGMGVMVVESSDEILSINKKMRHSMSVLKYGISNMELVIQEGVETILKVNNRPSENVLYSITDQLIGKLVRYNQEKDFRSNLNSTGMEIVVSKELDIVDRILSKLCNLTTQIEIKSL